MKKIKLSAWLVLFLGVVSFSIFEKASYAAPSPSPQAPAKVTSEDDDDYPFVEKNWYLFLGADAGLSSYGAYDSTLEGTRSGFHGGFRGLLAHYSEHWVVDGGLGFHFISNSGTNPDLAATKTKVTTRGGYIDFSPRYRAGKSWQLGPELEYWVSTDNGLNQNALSNTPSNNAIFAGLQVLYEWPTGQNKYRFGGRYLTNLNYTSRSVNVFQLFFQIGFSVFDSDRSNDDGEVHHLQKPIAPEQVNESDFKSDYVSPSDPLPLATPGEAAAPTPWPEPDVLSTPAPEATPVAAPPKAAKKLVLTLDVNDLPFEFDSARLPKYNSDRVREVGRFLSEHNKTWKSLIVEGHTDERGKKAYNQHLSLARAETVRQLLIEGGALNKKIKAVGFGGTKPKDKRHGEKAWARNRRVELNFKGVKDVVILQNALQRKEH